MSLRTSATRYARALLDVAIKESDPAAIEQNLHDFRALLDTNADLARALTSPGIPGSTRRRIVQEIGTKGGLAPPVTNLLALLADRNRIDLVPHLVDVYRERLLAYKNIISGTVTAAAPLAGDKVAALERSLSSATGKQVKLDVVVDQALIGGVVAQIGSTVYDGSVRTQLARLKQQLVGNRQ